jgi:glycerol-3-phosphate dehydrogenase (NAD(P)+)
MKGLESGSGKRLTQIFREEVGAVAQVVIWVGPGHVQDFYAGRPSCMVLGCEDIDITKKLVSEFNSSLIRLYYGQDLIGCEVGAAAKNVMGLAAGMLDGYDCPGLKGALMARGAREISRLVRAMGGNELTPYGLSHLGDYQATLFSEYSHNRLYGENFIRKIPMDKLAEGVETCKALMRLSKSYGIDLPICQGVYRILFEGASAADTLQGMFDRENKFEF